MKIKEFREEMGLEDWDDFMEFLEEVNSDGVVPALCTDGCDVEPDGRCEHGHPSILVAMGVI